jgi:hypothetical protein
MTIRSIRRRKARMKTAIFALLVSLLMATTPLLAEESVVFSGLPKIKISEGGVNRTSEIVAKEKAVQFKCTITKIDDKYYWTSRENTELLPVSSGAFITFWAANGSGYVRVIKPDMKAEVKSMVAVVGDPEANFDYVEHLLLGLRSVTYYGTAR